MGNAMATDHKKTTLKLLRETLEDSSDRKEMFAKLYVLSHALCDRFERPEYTDEELAAERASHKVPDEIKGRVSGDAIRLMLIPGMDKLNDDRMNDVFTLLGILTKYRSNMPDIVWLQLYEIALKNYIFATMGVEAKEIFDSVRNDPEVREMITGAMNDYQSQAIKT